MKTVYFNAPVVLEGKVSKGDARNRRICVPRKFRDEIAAPCWVWMRVDAGQPFFAPARRTKTRASIDITLPSFAVPRLPAGRVVHVEVAPAEASEPPPGGWLEHVDREHYFVQGLGDYMALWSGHEPPFHHATFSFRRNVALVATRFLPSLKDRRRTLSTSNAAGTNPRLIAKASAALVYAWDIQRERQHIALIHRSGTPDTTVRAAFKPLDLTISTVRATDKNDDSAVLFVRSSLPLVRMVISKLAHVFEHGFPSKAAALDYAIGWLDGDGSISLDRATGSINLRLAGTKEEASCCYKRCRVRPRLEHPPRQLRRRRRLHTTRSAP